MDRYFFPETSRHGIPPKGWIEVICGSMFSGKTEELIRRLNRARIANQRIQIFKPLIDTRYADSDVMSHDSRALTCTPVAASGDILLMANDADVIGIDEAQFFDQGLPEVCNLLANQGIRVIVAGLDMDYAGNPFGPLPALMAISEHVTKVHAICIRCGNPASYSHRTTESSQLVVLGETDIYEPLCRSCFNKERADR